MLFDNPNLHDVIGSQGAVAGAERRRPPDTHAAAAQRHRRVGERQTHGGRPSHPLPRAGCVPPSNTGDTLRTTVAHTKSALHRDIFKFSSQRQHWLADEDKERGRQVASLTASVFAQIACLYASLQVVSESARWRRTSTNGRGTTCSCCRNAAPSVPSSSSSTWKSSQCKLVSIRFSGMMRKWTAKSCELAGLMHLRACRSLHVSCHRKQDKDFWYLLFVLKFWVHFRNGMAASTALRKPAVSLADSTDLR